MRQHTPIREQHRLVKLWRSSGDGQTSFARSHNVHPSTFWTWTRRHAEIGASQAHFIDVTPAPEAAPAPTPAPVGMSVRLGAPGAPQCDAWFETPPPAAWFASVLRAAASW